MMRLFTIAFLIVHAGFVSYSRRPTHVILGEHNRIPLFIPSGDINSTLQSRSEAAYDLILEVYLPDFASREVYYARHPLIQQNRDENRQMARDFLFMVLRESFVSARDPKGLELFQQELQDARAHQRAPEKIKNFLSYVYVPANPMPINPTPHQIDEFKYFIETYYIPAKTDSYFITCFGEAITSGSCNLEMLFDGKLDVQVSFSPRMLNSAENLAGGVKAYLTKITSQADQGKRAIGAQPGRNSSSRKLETK